jgi:hypothetical protein
MSYTGRMVAKYVNASVNPDNYQLVDFDFDSSTLTEKELAAQILAYGNLLGSVGVIATQTQCIDITSRPSGSAGATSVPFPTAEYVALHALLATVGTYTSYTQFIGGGALAPLGTSVSVSERTAFPGRSGRGRHFLPYCGVSAVAADGSVDATAIFDIESFYNALFLGSLVGGPVATKAVVRPNNTLSGGHLIVSCKAQPIFSNLESRRR